MDCRDCEYYEKYEGGKLTVEIKPATFICHFGGINYYSNPEAQTCFVPKSKPTCKDCARTACKGCCDTLPFKHEHFTPKPKGEKTCKTCRFSSWNNDGKLCSQHPCSLPDLPKWQPIANPATISPEEQEHKDCEKCRNYVECAEEDTLIKPINCVKYKPKQKETKMWNKLKHVARMVGTGWLLYGLIWKLCIPFFRFANPHVVWLWYFVVKPHGEIAADADQADMAICWLFTAISIAIFSFACWILHCFTKWFWGK